MRPPEDQRSPILVPPDVPAGSSEPRSADHAVGAHASAAVPTDLAIPLGDFRILREIGRGGMGIVYEAEQLSLGRRIALKVLPFALTLDQRQLQRFRNEARAAAHLHHPNIVPIHSVGCERGVHFYAMQFIEGRTVAALIEDLHQFGGRRHEQPPRSGDGATARRIPAGVDVAAQPPTVAYVGSSAVQPAPGPAPVPPSATTQMAAALVTERSTGNRRFFRNVARLALQAAEALDHAHGQGVIHRDIKPANLIVDTEGKLWVTDFGLARLPGETGLTVSGDLVGTLRYMSPEQALAKRMLVDHRTDIYSLGATLYELLTLEPVFNGADREEVLRQIAFEEPRPLRRIDRSIPVDLETIVLKSMAKGVEERYATAQELAEDLRRFLDEKPILARPPSLREKAAKWSRRHRGVFALSIAVLLLAAVGFGLSTLVVVQEKAKTQSAYEQLQGQQIQTEAALAKEQERAREADEQRARAERSFQQAREAVDFLTQVSEEELAGQPQLTDLRRRLLEAALVYYQGFIDERADDPSSQEELAAARSRVSAILGELAAWEGFGRALYLTHLLEQPAVRHDLGLTPTQAEKARHLRGRPRKGPPPLGDFRQLSPDTRRARLEEMTRGVRRALADVLTPEQTRRLEQVALQQRGVDALADPAVAEALGLTPAQKKQLRTIQDEVHLAMRGARRAGGRPGGRPEPDRAKTNQRVLNVLTEEQKARWSEMTGEPFKGEVPRGRQP